MNNLKSLETALNIIILVQNILNNFSAIRMENLKYQSKNTEKKYLNNLQETQFLKVKNSLLQLEKYFIELKECDSPPVAFLKMYLLERDR